jgi:anion transporter
MARDVQALEALTPFRWINFNFVCRLQKHAGVALALVFGWLIWLLPPPHPLGEQAVHFFATLASVATLLFFGVLEVHVIAIMMLLVWILAGIVTPDIALGGFSKDSWFFVLSVLGIAAGVTKSGLTRRIILQTLRFCPVSYRCHTFILMIGGLLATPIMPTAKARIAIISPINKTLSDMLGLKDRSPGSAGLALSAYTGFSQAGFMFLTGATPCLIGWHLLPEEARSQFGWITWMIAALPAGAVTFLTLYFAIHFFYRVAEPYQITAMEVPPKAEQLEALNTNEWMSLIILHVCLIGWITTSLHGIDESWIALAGFCAFLTTGILDKKELGTRIDWGFLLFLGAISNLDKIVRSLGIDRWIIEMVSPLLSGSSLSAFGILMIITAIIYSVRFFLNKNATMMLLTVPLVSATQSLGIHPGVVLLTMLMALESWFLLYQNDAYQVMYYGTDGRAFSHVQARKLMVVRLIGSVIAVGVSIPYWKILGLIQ